MTEENSDLLGNIIDAGREAAVSTEIGDDGSIVMAFSDEQGQEPDPAPAASEQPTGEETPAPSAAEHGTPEDPLIPESRYKNLQGEFSRVTEERKELREKIARLEGRLDAMEPKDAPVEEPPLSYEEMEEIRNDPEKLAEYVKQKVQAADAEKQKAQDELRGNLQNEYDAVVAAHPDFVEVQGEVKSMLDAMPESNLSFEQAYGLVKWGQMIEEHVRAEVAGGPKDTAEGPPQGTPPTPPNAPATPVTTPAAPAAAPHVRMETGVSANAEEFDQQPKVSSIRDAMNIGIAEAREEA
jgi:hypothetical protein